LAVGLWNAGNAQKLETLRSWKRSEAGNAQKLETLRMGFHRIASLIFAFNCFG
jgi:hypothetical protein